MTLTVGKIKLRPVILVIAASMGLAVNVVAIGLVLYLVLAKSFEAAIFAAIIAFGSNLVTGIVGVATKLIESEEKGQ